MKKHMKASHLFYLLVPQNALSVVPLDIGIPFPNQSSTGFFCHLDFPELLLKLFFK